MPFVLAMLSLPRVSLLFNFLMFSAFVTRVTTTPLSLAAKSTILKPPSYHKRGFSVNIHDIGVKYSNSSGGQTFSATANVSDINDVTYSVPITLGGQDLVVDIDTGGFDLWIRPPPSRPLHLVNTTDVRANISAALGSVSGFIDFAEVKFAGYTIPSQAFLNVDPVSGSSTQFVDGVMGIGSDTGDIHEALSAAFGVQFADLFGQAPVSNILSQNSTGSNSFDILLGRTSDLDGVSNGTFTIGDHIPEFEAIVNETKLSQIVPGHWTVLLDGMDVNGVPFTFNRSSVGGVPPGKTVTVLDSGFSFPPLPPAAVDYIYSSIPGALVDEAGTWVVPCLGTTNLSFTLGGQRFPVHPLDITFPLVVSLPINGTLTNITVCENTYQYITQFPGLAEDGLDLILGDAFLRNVYASFHYGDSSSSSGNSSQTGVPFVQLLSTTDQDRAVAEFRTSRIRTLTSLPPTLDPAIVFQLESAAVAQQNMTSSSLSTTGALDTTSQSSGGDYDELTSLVQHYTPIIVGLIGGNLLVGLLLFSVAFAMCMRNLVRGGAKSRNIPASYAPVQFKDTVDGDVDDHLHDSRHD